MKLKIVGTGSKGNAYIVHNDNEALLIEAGCNLKAVKAALDYNIANVVGCLITHSHNDHSSYMAAFVKAGIDVFCLQATADAKVVVGHRVKYLQEGVTRYVGKFKVLAMPVKHDVPCVCFLIEHPDTGRFCFVTDTYYCPYVFPNLNNIIIEANYDMDIIDMQGDDRFLRNRILQSHMSIDTCEQFLRATDLSAVNSIVLIHLSDRNSDAEVFKMQISTQTGCNVYIAQAGMEIDFNRTPI